MSLRVLCLPRSLAPGVHHRPFLLEPSCRGKGFGTEAALMIMSYGKEVRADGVGRAGQAPGEGSTCWE